MPDKLSELEKRIDKLEKMLEGEESNLLLHLTVEETASPAIIVDEATAKASPCRCFTYKGKDYCFTKGAIGMLSAEQAETYCQAGKTYEVRPGIKERFQRFAEAAEEAHKKIEKIPKGERLVPWLQEMGKELKERGIEV
jgi:hypothetical protein